MSELSARAERELKGVHPALVAVVRRAFELVTDEYEVWDGLRTIEEQREFVRRGFSKTLRSYHLPQADGYGHAVDIIPVVNGKPGWPNEPQYWTQINAAMKQAGKELNVPVKNGYDMWGWDRPHWQIPRVFNWDRTSPDVPNTPEIPSVQYGNTREFVRAFQRKHNLVVDGDPGPITYAKLNEAT